MADYTEEISLPDWKLGDAWPSITFGPITIDEETPSLSLARVRMQFRQGSRVFTFDSSASADRDATITISNASTWIATIAEQTSFVTTPGKWEWDAEFYRTGVSAPWTLYKGSLIVHGQVTKPTPS
jgi:hypothetical protein